MNFVANALANARQLQRLTAADDWTHEGADLTVNQGISGQYITRVLDQAACFRGYPQYCAHR